jgi:hypothetical protein
MTAAATFQRGIDLADMPDSDITAMAEYGYSAHEIAERVAARSGLTYLRADDATAWLLNWYGPCGNCHERAGTQRMDDGKRFCGPCCSAAVAYDDPMEV